MFGILGLIWLETYGKSGENLLNMGHLLNNFLYLSQALYRDSSSFCLKAIISPLLFEVRVRGKNLLKYANSSQLLTNPYGRDSNQLVEMSLSENGNNCSLITSGLTPFSLIMLVILKNLPRCSFGSSLGCLVNWFCCTMVIRAGFDS